VWIDGTVLRVLSPAGQVNVVTLSRPANLVVRDAVGTLAAQFPCAGVDAHTVSCPPAGVVRYNIDTNDGNDRIVDLTSLPGTILAGAGNDSVADGSGNQVISLGIGNDFEAQGLGRDDVSGGPGTDVVSYASRAAAVSVRLDNLANDGQAGELDNARSDVENNIGGNANDLLVGSAAANVLSGLNGNDSLSGLAGPDVLIGGNGLDVGNGGAGIDFCQTEFQVLCP
jgi:hypothetical protein